MTYKANAVWTRPFPAIEGMFFYLPSLMEPTEPAAGRCVGQLVMTHLLLCVVAADGVALAFSVPKGGGTAVLEYFQDKMPGAAADLRKCARTFCEWCVHRGFAPMRTMRLETLRPPGSEMAG